MSRFPSAPAHRALPPHAAASGRPTAAAAILRPGINLWTWARRLPPGVEPAARAVAADGAWSARRVTAIDRRVEAAEALLADRGAPSPLLAQDVAALAFLFAHVAGVAEVRLRLDAVRDAPCPLFHVDHVALRLLCTYTGPGTQWVAEEDVRRGELGLRGRAVARANAAIAAPGAVRALRPGWAALVKGRGFGDGTPGLVHRSPASDEPRLLLVVDAAG